MLAYRIWKKYQHGTWIVAYMAFYLIAFAYLEKRQVYAYHVVHTVFDDFIPFQEAFIIPYVLWFPFIALTMLYFVFLGEKDEYYKLTANLAMGMTIFLAVSYLYPNILQLRPYEFPRENVLTDMVRWLYKTDTPTNVLPSIHVFNSLACSLAIFHDRKLREMRWLQVSSHSLTVLIILATMFLKQHSVLDVCLGIAMAFLGYLFFYLQDSVGEESYELAYASVGRYVKSSVVSSKSR